MKKRLIALMCTGIVGLTTLTGCSESFSKKVEIDEEFANCGRYAYCWPRDAVFITKALDILNMKKEAQKFYKVFCNFDYPNCKIYVIITCQNRTC